MVQEMVKQGRWEIVGGWFLQPDCNIPSGESILRQILSGQKYFAEKFGVKPTVGINFDTLERIWDEYEVYEKNEKTS